MATTSQTRSILAQAGLFFAGLLAVLCLGLLIATPAVPPLLGTQTKGLGTRIYDRRGDLVVQLSVENRVPVALERVPKDLQNAVIALEDRNFYGHHGVDFKGIVRAVLVNLSQGRVSQGASTLTQQLAKNIFLSSERSFSRKAREVLLALKIEARYSKDEILQLYFNQVYFGNGAYGVEAAARTYFGKHIEELDLAECALLAGIPRSPNRNNPLADPERARRRRDTALLAMASLGMLSEEQAETAMDFPVAVSGADPLVAGYFVEAVRQDLEKKYGADAVYRGGLAVHTTLDLALQDAAQRAVEKGLRRAEARTRANVAVEAGALEANPLQAAFVAMDPSSGAVLAMVGGRDYKKHQFNRAMQAKRQPGSAFKPFIYAAAIEDGYTPADTLDDSPTVFRTLKGEYWSPANFDEKFAGPTTLRNALADSRNVVTAKLLAKVGLEKAVACVRQFGFKHRLTKDLSLSLGTNEVSLLELSTGYCALANQGLLVQPWLVQSVEDADGNNLEERQPQPKRAVPPATAYIVTQMLRSVIDGGTASGLRGFGLKGMVAGKTGTTTDYSDAWFVGYTPDLVAGAWFGYDRRPEFLDKTHTGATVAAPVWADFMVQATAGRPLARFPAPPGIEVLRVCADSGRPCDQSCRRCIEETFAEGSREPMAIPEARDGSQFTLVRVRAATNQAELLRAVKLHRAILQANPRTARSWRELGEAYYRLQRWDYARQCFKQYLLLAEDPKLAAWLKADKKRSAAAPI